MGTCSSLRNTAVVVHIFSAGCRGAQNPITLQLKVKLKQPRHSTLLLLLQTQILDTYSIISNIVKLIMLTKQ